SYALRTTANFALAYFCLIIMGVLERLGAFLIDTIRDKPGQPWRIFPRACIYFLITLDRYLLMMAIMNGYVPMLLIVCLGLALGQINAESIRYAMMMWKLKKAGTNGFEPLKPSNHHQSSQLGDSCC
ncbi:hypothetical protein GGI21_004923, partial [Coemansia aciculifera]